MEANSVLFLSTADSNVSYSLLFHCAKHWAEKGNRVLFITKAPLKSLPFAVGKNNHSPNPDAFKLIQFMYLSNWKELLQQLYLLHLRHNPVSIVIIKNLENYFENDFQVQNDTDHVSLICASLLYGISACSKVTCQPVFLVNDYVCSDSVIEKSVVKNFFHNVWELETFKDKMEKTFTKISKLSVDINDKVFEYTFSENLDENFLNFERIIKNLVKV